LRDGELAGEGGRRKDRGIVLLDEGAQKIPDCGVRIREVDVAAPYPASPVAFRPYERGRLRIMDDEQVLHKLHALAVLLVIPEENIEDLFAHQVFAAV
jgi:hypothetical protein